MKRIITIITIICVLTPITSYSQTIAQALSAIESNNLTLKAYHKMNEAEKLNHRIGLAPTNPDIDFTYAWGSPTMGGNKIALNATQSFYFPTVYARQNQIAHLRNTQADLSYQKQRNEILWEATQICYKIVFYNALLEDLDTCAAYILGLADIYQKKLAAGSCNIFDYNKIKLNALNLKQEIELKRIEQEALHRELTRLNGGIPIALSQTLFSTPEIANDFETWYQKAIQNNPNLQIQNIEIEVSKRQTQLAKSMYAPHFKIGYALEHLPNEQFSGITAGISIPLWENSKTIQHAKAQEITTQALANDAKMQFYNHMQMLHERYLALRKIEEEFKANISQIENLAPMTRALQSGEISIEEFFLEYTAFHESHVALLNLQHEAALCRAMLQIYE